MKKLMFTIAIFALAITPALADCPEGQHYVEANTVIPEHYIDGECNAWSTPVCTPGYWYCDQWGPLGILCWDWDWQPEVCSTPVCTGYEQILVPEEVIEGGYCEDDEVVVPEPEVKPMAGMLLLNGLSNIVSQEMYECSRVGNAITCNWLCQQESKGILYVNGEPVEFALDGFGALLGEFGRFGAFGNYGYSDALEATGLTYMTVEFNNSGTVYVRPGCVDKFGSVGLGSQLTVE